MYLTDKSQAALAIIECFELAEGELRETLYTHNATLDHTILAHLHTLLELTTNNATGLRQAAQSLLNFLEQRVNRVAITGDRNRIVLLLDSLRRQIRPSADDGPLAERRPKQPACLFLDSHATTFLLQEAIATSGHCIGNICGMTNVVMHARSDLPVTIVTDLSMLRDDPQTRDKIQKLRQIHPKARLFCLSSASHFAARLEAVRLGASRFLIKPLNVDKLIALLDDIAIRKEREPFHALLVDDGRALTALHAHTARATDPNVGARSAALYPEVIVSDVYMTGCKALQLAAALHAAPATRDTGGRSAL